MKPILIVAFHVDDRDRKVAHSEPNRAPPRYFHHLCMTISSNDIHHCTPSANRHVRACQRTVRPSKVARPSVLASCGTSTTIVDDSDTMKGRDARECGAMGVSSMHGTDGATSEPPAERL
jgi:hypothetical protein